MKILKFVLVLITFQFPSYLTFSQSNPWLINGNSLLGNASIGTISNHNLNIITNNTIKYSFLNDGRVGQGITDPRGAFELVYCPPNGLSWNGLVITKDDCLSQNVAFDPLQFDQIGMGIGTSPSSSEDPFTLPISYLSGGITNNISPLYSSDNPLFWVRTQYSNISTPGITNFNTKFVVMPDGSVGVNVALPRAGIDVRGSQEANYPAAIFSSRALGTHTTSPQGLIQYYTQLVQIVPNLGDDGFNRISTAGDQGIFFSDGKSTNGANLNSNLIIAPWSDVASFNNNGGLRIKSTGDIDVLGDLTTYGEIETYKLTVESFNWPDYVFNENYELMTLDSVKSYILLHHHLPGVSSRKEVQERGLDIAKSQEELLLKIEELTLYILQQEVRIKELETKL